jgi:hypothetical protein
MLIRGFGHVPLSPCALTVMDCNPLPETPRSGVAGCSLHPICADLGLLYTTCAAAPAQVNLSSGYAMRYPFPEIFHVTLLEVEVVLMH